MPRPVITSPQRKRRMIEGKLQTPSSNVQGMTASQPSISVSTAARAVVPSSVTASLRFVSEWQKQWRIATARRKSIMFRGDAWKSRARPSLTKTQNFSPVVRVNRTGAKVELITIPAFKLPTSRNYLNTARKSLCSRVEWQSAFTFRARHSSFRAAANSGARIAHAACRGALQQAGADAARWRPVPYHVLSMALA